MYTVCIWYCYWQGSTGYTVTYGSGQPQVYCNKMPHLVKECKTDPKRSRFVLKNCKAPTD